MDKFIQKLNFDFVTNQRILLLIFFMHKPGSYLVAVIHAVVLMP